jgi:hypothetical protein
MNNRIPLRELQLSGEKTEPAAFYDRSNAEGLPAWASAPGSQLELGSFGFRDEKWTEFTATEVRKNGR